MSPNLFHNNVKCSGDSKNHIGYLNVEKSGQASKGLPNSISLVTNDHPTNMEQNNTKARMLRNNLKAENLKSKIDLLIMSKTKAMPPAQDEAEENIQSIQEEINNLFTGRLNAAVTPNTPAMDAKSSNSSKLPMSPAKPGDSHLNTKHPTTVDNVEHLLETMFQDNKTPPAKASTHPAKPNSHSKSNSPMVNLDSKQNVEHLLESMFQDNKSRTSPVRSNSNSAKANSTQVIPDSKNVEHLLESMFQENKTSPAKTKSTLAVPDGKQNVEHLLETMFQETKTSPVQANTNSKHSNRTSLSVEAIESILRTPSPVDDDDVNVKHTTRSSNSHAKSRVPSSSSPSVPAHNNSTTSPRQSLRNKRLRTRSMLEESQDDSSSDSTKLEIIDDYLSRSQEFNRSEDTSTKKTHANNQANNVLDLSGEAKTSVNCKDRDANSKTDAVRSASSNCVKALDSADDKEAPACVKQEQPSPRSKTKAATKENSLTQALCNPIMAVETELELMFAGIVKEEEESPATSAGAGKVVKSEACPDSGSKRTRNNRRRSSELFPSSPEPLMLTPPKRKKKSKQTLPTKAGGKKKSSSSSSLKGSLNSSARQDTSNDSLSGGGRTSGSAAVPKVSPFVRLYPGSGREALVVNSTRGDDEAAVSTSGTAAVKKPAGFVPNKKMRSSAQSNLQPANRTDVLDPTWFCVFCKRGPNTFGAANNPLGDLFGPYRIGPPQDGYLDADEFKRRVARGSPGKSEKKKRSMSVDVDPARLSAGLTRVPAECSTLDNGARSSSGGCQYEVWFHEACVVWGTGVYLVGGSLLGLDQCVWAALNSTCVNCGESGASIGCVKSKCRGSVHYSCALHIGWYLDPTTFVATCSVHREKYVAERYLETPGSGEL